MDSARLALLVGVFGVGLMRYQDHCVPRSIGKAWTARYRDEREALSRMTGRATQTWESP